MRILRLRMSWNYLETAAETTNEFSLRGLAQVLA